MKIKNLIESLIVLDEEAKRLDENIKDVRMEIHNLLWDLMALKKPSSPNQTPKNTKHNSQIAVC